MQIFGGFDAVLLFFSRREVIYTARNFANIYLLKFYHLMNQKTNEPKLNQGEAKSYTSKKFSGVHLKM
jgi:hypothetical protein